jgi:polyisoprenoid-binding protein YceI
MTRLRRLFQHRALIVVVFLVGVVGVAAVTQEQWHWLLEDDHAHTTGAVAPALEDLDASTEALYRITPGGGSELTYHVEESLAGRTGTATGTSSVLAGDIAVSLAEPEASRIGTIVINVEMFESDSALRDKRIRHDFLESTHYPFATFEATEVEGIPSAIGAEASGALTIHGDLTIKEITAPVTFTGPVSVDAETLRADMTGMILMSTYDIGPIHVAGLAHTDDEVRFDLSLVAGRAAGDVSPPDENVLRTAAADPRAGEGRFAASVQPILESGCVSCHAEGGPGWSTVELDTAGKAAEIAEDIALVTAARYMPPWPASDLSPAFEHDFSLTDDQIETIGSWADGGGGLDVAPSTKLVADDPPFDDIERDQVVPARGVYVGDLAVQDDYRCLVHEIDDPEGDGEWVTGIAFEPDKDEVVHHSIIYRVPAEGREEADRLDGADGRPGWSCFGRSNLETAGVRSIGGWAPGQQPRVYPEGVGLYLEPGDFIVNQIHYHFDEETPPDQSVLVFDTMSSTEVATRDEPMTHIRGRSYLTPAEGPCTPEETGPLCDRDAVLDDIAGKYGGGARFIPDALIRQCGGAVDDYDDLDGTRFSSSCDLPAADFGTLYSVLGHMHEFGAAYRMTLNPDTPDERVLLDIPSWSFEWQLYYVPTEKIRIEPGDTLRFECTWDRANLTMPEPRYITWNEGTVDEMCFSSVAVVPDTNVEGTPNGFGG